MLLLSGVRLLTFLRKLFCWRVLYLSCTAPSFLELVGKQDCPVECNGQPTVATANHHRTKDELGERVEGAAEGEVRLHGSR